MKANELRIGNYVYHNIYGEKQVLKITNITDYAVNLDISNGDVSDQIDLDEIEPIPLTEELLEKCGFTKVGSNYEKDWLLLHTHLERQTFDFLLYESSSGKLKATPILYLHQLQNLYFALTGEELKIDL